MKKIALVSCYFQHNYGSQLQAFALQEFLVQQGFAVENISVKGLVDFENGKRTYYRSKLFDFKFIKAKFGMAKHKLAKKIGFSNKSQNFRIRDAKFCEFEKNFILSRNYKTYKELSFACPKEYSDVIVGSDQLWLPVNVIADYYTLTWVPLKINKISFSTSFGFSKIPEKYKHKYQSFLSRIDHLSVREDSGKALIENNFHLDAKTVCDPTMLLTYEQWKMFSKKDRIIHEKYIFVYFLGKNKKHWDFVKKLKEKTGLQIVSLNHCDEFYKYADKCSDVALYDIDPFDFLNLVFNSEYICTDSFHGSVFSILSEKKFFTFRRFSDKSDVSTNSRVYSLLHSFNLDDHLLNDDAIVDNALSINFDCSYARRIVSDYRQLSIRWLFDALTKKQR